MFKNIFYPAFFFLLLFACPGYSQATLVVEVKSDAFPFDNYWQIKQAGEVIFEKPRGYQRHTVSRDTIILDESKCYSFSIFDLRGNGLCCEDGDGYFKLYLDGNLIREGGSFLYSDFEYFNCENGNGCIGAIPVQTGEHIIKNKNEQWHWFVPDSTGKYHISTCPNSGICPVKIWCYDQCLPSLTGRGRPGTLFFAEQNCGQQAEISATLFKDSAYLIRIGADPVGCKPDSIQWFLTFEGVASGCTNPRACNYDPTAVQDDGSCLFNGDPDCPEGPDLAIDEDRFKTSLSRSVLDNDDPCLLQEGCIKGYGKRTIIRFDTWIDNMGSTDYFVGTPPDDYFTPDPIWEFDICHNHWHYEGYASYHLFDSNGQKTPVGFKNGFCVMDVGCHPGSTPSYFCQYQGISANCYDLYDKDLDCQWIDITDVPAGNYTLVTEINTLRNPDALGRQELGYENNWAQVCIEIFEDETTDYKGFVEKEPCDRYVDCLGELYGNAQPDCSGTCNGTALQGDLDKNLDRNSFDVLHYLYGIVHDSLPATNCSDLNLDDRISITDAALLLHCASHEGSQPVPGHYHAPCEFPFTISNPYDSTWLYVTNWHKEEAYFDLAYLSPYSDLTGLQMSFYNLQIDRVEGLLPNYRGEVFNGEQTLAILSFEEDLIPRNQSWTNLLRIYYRNLSSNEICPSNTTVVNDVLEEIIPVSTNCLKTSAAFYPAREKRAWDLFPNPNKGSFILFNSGALHANYELTIFDSRGIEQYKSSGTTRQSIAIQSLDLPQGSYFYRLSWNNKTETGRFIFY